MNHLEKFCLIVLMVLLHGISWVVMREGNPMLLIICAGVVGAVFLTGGRKK